MTWTWELYQDASGEISKELLAFFIGMIPEQELPSNLPSPVLTKNQQDKDYANLRREKANEEAVQFSILAPNEGK